MTMDMAIDTPSIRGYAMSVAPHGRYGKIKPSKRRRNSAIHIGSSAFFMLVSISYGGWIKGTLGCAGSYAPVLISLVQTPPY